MKLKKTIIIALVALISVMSLSALVGCKGNTINGADAIIMIDVGAQVEMILDSAGRVITTNALNEEGEVLLIDSSYDGNSYKTAISNLIALAQNMGYVNNLNNVVFVDSISTDDASKVLLNRELFDIIKSVDKTIDVKAYSYTIERLRYNSFIKNIDGLENLSFLQYRLITSIMQHEENIRLSELIKLNIKELTLQLVNRYREVKIYGSAAMAREMRNLIKSEKKEISSTIMEKHTAEVQSLNSAFDGFNTAILDLLAARNIKEFTVNEVTTILGIVNITKPDDISKALYIIGGGTTVYRSSAIGSYIEKLYLDMTFPTDGQKEIFENKINDARKLFDPLYVIISHEEKALLISAISEEPEAVMLGSITKIDQLYSVVNVMCLRLTDMYHAKKAELTGDVISDIAGMEKEFSLAETRIKSENQQKIADEVSRLRSMKQKRLDNYAKFVTNYSK